MNRDYLVLLLFSAVGPRFSQRITLFGFLTFSLLSSTAPDILPDHNIHIGTATQRHGCHLETPGTATAQTGSS
jgi:hypothetical protein